MENSPTSIPEASNFSLPDDIIAELRYFKREFPEAAIQAAHDLKEEITPLLLALLEETVENYEALMGENFFGHIYALFLLASFREKRAFSLAIKIASLPGDWPDELLGDSITESFHRILASLYNNNLKELQSLIENTNTYHYSRSAAILTLSLLVKENILERSYVLNYFKELLNHPTFLNNADATTDLIYTACYLYPDEIYTDIQKAFKEERVKTDLFDMEWVDEVITSGKEATLDYELYNNNHMTLVDDVINELSWWACFNDPDETFKFEPFNNYYTDHQESNFDWIEEPEISTTYIRDTPKIGRNAPCPCGSNRKYKKCCLQ